MSLTISLLKIEIFNKTNLKARHLEIGTSEISNHFTIPLSRTRQHLIVLKARLLQKCIGNIISIISQLQEDDHQFHTITFYYIDIMTCECY